MQAPPTQQLQPTNTSFVPTALATGQNTTNSSQLQQNVAAPTFIPQQAKDFHPTNLTTNATQMPKGVINVNVPNLKPATLGTAQVDLADKAFKNGGKDMVKIHDVASEVDQKPIFVKTNQAQEPQQKIGNADDAAAAVESTDAASQLAKPAEENKTD